MQHLGTFRAVTNVLPHNSGACSWEWNKTETWPWHLFLKYIGVGYNGLFQMLLGVNNFVYEKNG